MMDRQKADEFIGRVFCIGSKSGSNRVRIPVLTNPQHKLFCEIIICVIIFFFLCFPLRDMERGQSQTPQVGYLFDSGARPLPPRLVPRNRHPCHELPRQKQPHQ
jgi:hypothetical protein